MRYKEVLVRYLLLDIVAIFILLAIVLLAIPIIRKILPPKDPSNNIVRKILYVILISGSIIGLFLASSEIYHISIDMQDELYISSIGSFTTDRDRMYFTSENGEQVLLKIRPIIPDVESCKQATIIYSKNSQILLEVILE